MGCQEIVCIIAVVGVVIVSILLVDGLNDVDHVNGTVVDVVEPVIHVKDGVFVLGIDVEGFLFCYCWCLCLCLLFINDIF